jgi:hypothetical protein
MSAESPDWIVPIIGLGGAVIVAVANFAVQRWRYRLDRLGGAIDHLCAELNSAAELSSTYWLLDTTQRDHAEKARILEPELVGRQIRLQSLFIAIRILDRRLDTDESSNLLISFYDDLTGGDFKTLTRPPDLERCQGAHSDAARLNGALRRALAERMKLWR